MDVLLFVRALELSRHIRASACCGCQVYGKSVPRLSPVFANATGAVNGEIVTVTVSFQPETVVDGLTIIPGAVCPPQFPKWVVSLALVPCFCEPVVPSPLLVLDVCGHSLIL